MPEINDWDIAAANNNDAPPDGWPENTMQYSEVNNTAREGMAVVARFYQDSNGTLVTGGVADAYTLALNASYAAYFAGMYIAAEFSATNTGATTIDMNGIGVQSIVDRGGNPLSAGEIQSGGIYELRYDGTNFQLMGTVVGVTTVAQAVFTNSNAIDLVDVDVPINVGAVDPSTSFHTEIAAGQIQAKSDATNATTLEIQPHGGDTRIGNTLAIADGSIVSLIHGDTFTKLDTQAAGIFLFGATDGNPATPQAINTLLNIESRDGNSYARLGFPSSVDLRLESFSQSGSVSLIGAATGGASRNLFTGDPDGNAAMYFQGNLVAETDGLGTFNIQAIDNTLTSTIQLRLTQLGNTTQAIFGFEAVDNDTLSVQNQRTNGEIDIRANDGGVIRNYIEIDPQTDEVRGFFNGNPKWQFNETGLNDIGMAGQIADDGDVLRPIGMNVMPPETVNAAMTFDLTDNGRMKVHDEGATVRSWTVDQSTDVPVGAIYGIVNIGGDITLISGAGVAFEYWNGAGWTNTTGNITLGFGQFTIYKRSDIEYIVNGPNIT